VATNADGQAFIGETALRALNKAPMIVGTAWGPPKPTALDPNEDVVDECFRRFGTRAMSIALD
jgi:hypothetical protein